MQTPSGHPVESTSAKRLVVLASGGGSNLAALLAAHDDAAYGARVVGLVTDRPTAGALDLARDAGVASAVVALKDFDDRAAWNDGVLEAISVFRPDYVILAGFMRILAPGVVRRFEGRMINTHPALLPSFPGAHGVRDALAHGVKVTGCTVHVVDDGVLEAISVFRPDYVILAGFMRILAPGVVRTFEGRMINTHPALLPAFPGAHAHGVKVTGCTVHVVDDGVDTGPILAQTAVPVLDSDDEPTLTERIKVAERALLVETVGRLSREGLHIAGRKASIGR